MPVFKVWNGGRTVKKMIVAENLEELVHKGSEKLNIESQSVRLVLETDGTEIEDNEVLLELRQHTLQLLSEAEDWSTVVEEVHVPSMSEPSTPQSPTPKTSEGQPVVQQAVITPVQAAISDPGAVRVTSRTPLPQFSIRVQKKLKEGDALAVWNSAINEAADYYLSKVPNIGSRSEYQAIGIKMMDEYPALKQEGVRDWSLFTSCLSQRIRHVRWNESKKTKPASLNDDSSPPAKKKAPAVSIPQRKELEADELVFSEDYDFHLKELVKEWGRREPSNVHIKTMLKEMFQNNRQWIRSLPDGEVTAIVEKIPCYLDGHFGETMAAADGSETSPGKRMLPIIKFVEEGTKLDRGKGLKTKSIVQEFKDVPDEKIEELLKNPRYTPPQLRMFTRSGKLSGVFVVTDGINIMCGPTSFNGAILVVLAAYYVFDLEYPRVFSRLLGLLQKYLLGQAPVNDLKSAKYLKFCSKLNKAMKTCRDE